jgi:hypothetical protein
MDLSISYFNLSQALSPEHTNELARFCLGDPLLAPLRISYSYYIIYK